MYRLYIFILLFVIGCEKEPKPVVVTYQLSRIADTTFNKQYKDSLKAQMDTFCIQNYNALYIQTRDSLIKLELAKIEELIYGN
ncbi:MAG: hypothetical protein V3V00_07915 [Saprospiraceae bacterium]